jgi:hypothetical protein
MDHEQETNILLSLLIILSLLSFTRTLVYIIFDHDLLSVDKFLGFNSELIMQGVLTIFAILRLLICSLILIKKPFKINLITIVLIYLIITSFLRFYYEYLYFYKPNSKEKYYIDKYQDVNAILIFISSAYILYYIFFK